MSYFDYEQSKKISMEDPSFYGLIMSAMRQADSINTMKLERAWPDVYNELRQRYNAPGGVLHTDPASLQIKVLGQVLDAPEG